MIISIFSYSRYKKEFPIDSFYSMLIINLIFYLMYDRVDYYILSILLIISAIDYKKKIIPNDLLIVLLPLVFINIDTSFNFQKIIIIFFIILLIIISQYTQILGMGDVKLLIILYLIKGQNFINLLILHLSILLFTYSIYLLIKTKSTKQSFALGPLILLSYILSI